MGALAQGSFDAADEVRNFDKGRAELVKVEGHTIGRFTMEPGWKWSEAVKPMVGTERCELEHIGVVLSGTMRVQTEDGESDLSSGGAYRIPPGHDAWVVGDEAFVALEFQSAADYAKS